MVYTQSKTKPRPYSFRRSDASYDHWSRQTNPSPPGHPLPSLTGRKQRRHQGSSGCRAVHFGSGAISFRGLSYPQGIQTRGVWNHLLRKALPPILSMMATTWAVPGPRPRKWMGLFLSSLGFGVDHDISQTDPADSRSELSNFTRMSSIHILLYLYDLRIMPV